MAQVDNKSFEYQDIFLSQFNIVPVFPLMILGSITLEEMEEVVGILYNLDGSEKVKYLLCCFMLAPFFYGCEKVECLSCWHRFLLMVMKG